MMEQLYIPNLHTFAMENEFTGSCGAFRFKITPNVVKATKKEVDFANSSITVEFWHGVLCYEKSQMEGSASFPLTEEGRQAMLAYLQENI